MAILAALTFWRARPRWLATIPALLLAVGLVAFVNRSPLQPIRQPAAPFAAHGAQLLGYRAEQNDGYLYLYPSWYVSDTPPEAFQAHWYLQDAAGQTVSEVTAWPYFNTTRASNWPPGTLQADAYQMALPAGLPAGEYHLAVRAARRPRNCMRPPSR